MEVTITYNIIGFNIGSVIFLNCCPALAPSMEDASYSAGSIPMIPAIKRIVVFPVHIIKLINAIRRRILHSSSRKLNAVPNNWFTGPVTANNVANNTATDDAINIFGRYKITFTAPVPFNLSLKSVNQEANNKEIKICGINPSNHSKNVLPKYFRICPSVNTFT